MVSENNKNEEIDDGFSGFNSETPKSKIPKIFSKCGETIAEVLIATLIGAVGSVMFATMAVSALRIFKVGTDRIAQYADTEERLETRTGKLSDETIYITDESGNDYSLTDTSGTVAVYGDEEKGIYAYVRN